MTERKTERKEEPNKKPARLYRSETDKFIAGVAGGLGEYFGIDSTILRIIFVVLAISGGAGVLLYIVLWILMPASSSTKTSEELLHENVGEMKQRAKEFAHSLGGRTVSSNKDDSRFLWGALIILVGIIFLLNNYGIISMFELRRLWPFLLIIVGFAILTRKN